MLGEYLRINNDKQYVDKDKLKKLVNNFLDNLLIMNDKLNINLHYQKYEY